MLKTLTAGCAGIAVVLLWLSGGGPAGPGAEVELAAAGQDREFVPITDEMLRNPDPADWLMAHRTYDFQGFSPLEQITRENVGQLRLAWMRAMDEGDQEIRPLVYDGVMYIANPGSDHLQAIDATTGDLVWDFERELPDDLRQYARVGGRTRHLALYGNHVYHLTADAHIIAVDARTGELAWELRTANYREGISHSSGAMMINGNVVSGRTCSSSSREARCFVAAHDADSGTERWRTYTAAGDDDPGGETWGALPTARRVHVSPWGIPGSYDPDQAHYRQRPATGSSSASLIRVFLVGACRTRAGLADTGTPHQSACQGQAASGRRHGLG